MEGLVAIPVIKGTHPCIHVNVESPCPWNNNTSFKSNTTPYINHVLHNLKGDVKHNRTYISYNPSSHTSAKAMSYAKVLARATYGDNSRRQKTGLAIGLICGVFAVMFFTAMWIRRCKRDQEQVLRDPEAQRAEQRRVYGGWYGQKTHRETAVERRSRMAREARISRGLEGGIEREARREREAREGQPAPPMYQLPSPTYSTTPETRRQWLLANQPSANPPLPSEDAPPAYDSPAVWSSRG